MGVKNVKIINHKLGYRHIKRNTETAELVNKLNITKQNTKTLYNFIVSEYISNKYDKDLVYTAPLVLSATPLISNRSDSFNLHSNGYYYNFKNTLLYLNQFNTDKHLYNIISGIQSVFEFTNILNCNNITYFNINPNNLFIHGKRFKIANFSLCMNSNFVYENEPPSNNKIGTIDWCGEYNKIYNNNSLYLPIELSFFKSNKNMSDKIDKVIRYNHLVIDTIDTYDNISFIKNKYIELNEKYNKMKSTDNTVEYDASKIDVYSLGHLLETILLKYLECNINMTDDVNMLIVQLFDIIIRMKEPYVESRYNMAQALQDYTKVVSDIKNYKPIRKMIDETITDFFN